MLRELHISNLAVIEDAVITLGPGLNAFTGQTGAGKSLVLGALEGLLGVKPLAKMVRGGLPDGAEARVDAVFELASALQAQAVSALLDESLAPGDELVLSRKASAGGRGGVRANGKPVAAAVMKELAPWLVDIHGQHDGQRLMKPSEQLAVLDDWAGCAAARAAYAVAWERLQALLARRVELLAGAELRRERLELYGFQAKELDGADPKEGEFADLSAREKVLGSTEQLRAIAETAVAQLDEADDGEALVARLRKVEHKVADLAAIDAGLTPLHESVRGALIALQEAAYDLRRYADRQEGDPEALGETRARLDALIRLTRKYGRGEAGEDELAAVLAHRAKIGAEITRLEREQVDSGSLETDLTAACRALAQAASALSVARQKAAGTLGPLIERELRDLGMAEAKVKVEVASADGATCATGHLEADLAQMAVSAGPSGFDDVFFAVRTNPGQPWAKMREVASGGELSRVMLALKGVLAAKARGGAAAAEGRRVKGSIGAAAGSAEPGACADGALLVFDEVDANIGGRLGDMIGRKLKALAGGRGQDRGQVLCITHLPQIAAFADHHLRIVKEVSGVGESRTTRTRVEALSGEARVAELADMLAGQNAGEVTRKQARELIAAAA